MCMHVARRTGRAGTLTVASRNVETNGSWTCAIGSNVSLHRPLRRRDSTRVSTWVSVSERSEKIMFDWGSSRVGFRLSLSNGFSFGIFANHRWLFVQDTRSTRRTWAVGSNRAWRRIGWSEGRASRCLGVYRRHNSCPLLLLGCCLCLDWLRLRSLCLNR